MAFTISAENATLKRVTKLFHGYEVPELLKVIADDYRNPRAADIVRDARCMWLIDFADALLTDTTEWKHPMTLGEIAEAKEE